VILMQPIQSKNCGGAGFPPSYAISPVIFNPIHLFPLVGQLDDLEPEIFDGFHGRKEIMKIHWFGNIGIRV
jgi:hypothetical protein